MAPDRLEWAMSSLRMFLAIPYSPTFGWVRDSIAAACRPYEVELRSIDEQTPPGGEIPGKIHQEIDDADFATAVLTDLNANVLYELGRLHQASKPTVVLAAKGQSIPFDIRTFSRIEYEPDPDARSDLEKVLGGAFGKLLHAMTKEGRSEIALGSYRSVLSASGKTREVTSLALDFEDIRRQAERAMGKSGCETSDIQSLDTDSFKGWHQRVTCPDGDDLRIVIDMNGEIKRVRKI